MASTFRLAGFQSGINRSLGNELGIPLKETTRDGLQGSFSSFHSENQQVKEKQKTNQCLAPTF